LPAGATRACKLQAARGAKRLNDKELFDGTRAAWPGCGQRPVRLARYHHFTKGDIMKRVIALALAATFALPSFALLTGCNTVEGAGKDIQAGGAKIKEEARENKKY
jgi:predicted small secreted protein